MTAWHVATLLGAGGLVAAGAPAVTAIGPFRRALSPRLCGVGPTQHIALTFDDGPDGESTPAFLDLLAEHHRAATFFVLAEQATRNAPLMHRMVAEGHEVALHGWTHRCVAAVPPGRLASRLRAAREAIEDVSGTAITWYRPPYGVLTTEALLASRNLDLTPVLWTAWGREWEHAASPERITQSVMRTLRPGGTILLHDTDRHAPHGDWRRTFAATRTLLAGPLTADQVGPLHEHWRC